MPEPGVGATLACGKKTSDCISNHFKGHLPSTSRQPTLLNPCPPQGPLRHGHSSKGLSMPRGDPGLREGSSEQALTGSKWACAIPGMGKSRPWHFRTNLCPGQAERWSDHSRPPVASSQHKPSMAPSKCLIKRRWMNEWMTERTNERMNGGSQQGHRVGPGLSCAGVVGDPVSEGATQHRLRKN